MVKDDKPRTLSAGTSKNKFISALKFARIRAWMSSKFGQIRPWTTELAALESHKNPHKVIMGKMESPLYSRLFLVVIPFILAGNGDIHVHKSLDESEIRSFCH